MGYASPLEARIAKKVTKAITEYNLIEDGDRVMVGLSGGKDSWALLQILDILRQRAPISFSLIGVTVDSGYDGYRHDLISSTCEARGWEYRIIHTEIGDVMEDLLARDATPCSLCARLRRGVLYQAGNRSRRHQDRARPSPRRLHRDLAPQPLLRRRIEGHAGPPRLRQRRARGHPSARRRHRVRSATVRQGANAAHHQLLLPGVRRSQPAAPAHQAAHRGARGRASRSQELDDQGAGERCPPASSRPPPQPAARTARGRGSARGRAAASRAA